MIQIDQLQVAVEDTVVIQNLTLSFAPGTITALMGPNGSGKSSFAAALMGHPAYSIRRGSIFLKERDITQLNAAERARAGIFLAFQYPVSIPGLTVFSLLQESVRAIHGGLSSSFKDEAQEACHAVGLDASFLYRGVNEGFSGGEKKRLELMQLQLLKPKVAILDEIDSGLDVDALKMVARIIRTMKERDLLMTVIIITHYNRLFDYLVPDRVCVIKKGEVQQVGGIELAHIIEQKGYDAIK